jgi:hypothetical protein
LKNTDTTGNDIIAISINNAVVNWAGGTKIKPKVFSKK